MAGEDRLSALPSELKVSILSRLEVKDAIRTAALSHSWRHLWTYRPRLCLGWCSDTLDDTGIHSGFPVASSWIERVHHVVSALRGPLLYFALSHGFSSQQFALLQRILDLLNQKGSVETLHLSCHFDRGVIHLPSFRSLEELQLRRCRIILPADFRGFDRLSSLTLSNVQISNDHLHLLIHLSKNLTTFKAMGFAVALGDQPVSIKLNLPFLRYLEFGLNQVMEKVEVVSTPCLDQAKIWNLGFRKSKKFASLNLGLLTSIAATVSSLSLDLDVLECLSLATLPLNFTFLQLRQLKLVLCIQSMDKRMYNAFIWLLRSMLFLEELHIKVGNNSSDANMVDVRIMELFSMKYKGLSCLDKTLKSVKIVTKDLNDVMTNITLVKFFMLNAGALKIMNVRYWTGSEVESNMIEELQKAKVTTSSKANVVIIRLRENVTINVK